MFINTKKTIKIVSDNGIVFSAKAGWIGEVPEWAQKHWYFKALCKDGTVTSIVSAKNKAVQAVVEQNPDTGNTSGNSELDALRAHAAELKIPRYSQLGKDKLTTAIAEAEAKLKQTDIPNPNSSETLDPKSDDYDGGGSDTPGEQK
jgi:hypothetical protein